MSARVSAWARKLLAIGSCATFVPVALAAIHPTRAEQAFLQATNESRVSHGLAPLRTDTALLQVARAHSLDMVRHGYFAHTDYARRMFAVGAGPTVGEALAWGTGPEAAPHVLVAEWLASPEHRVIVLRPGFRNVGIGVVYGPFKGWKRAAVVTADFEGR